MRPVSICACLFACLAVSCLPVSMAAAPKTLIIPSDVTVILDIKGPYSPIAIREMEKEATRIIKTSGIQLDWQRLESATHAVFNDLVVMTFKGSCTFDPPPPVYDELGPYALTRTANGEVQPFGEVDCDHVVRSVRAAMFGGDFNRAEMLIGRALGRVVAHELVHMLTKSGAHANDGVQKAALSGKQLIAHSLPLSAMDVERLRAERHGGSNSPKP
jgi:hypothetical protein